MAVDTVRGESFDEHLETVFVDGRPVIRAGGGLRPPTNYSMKVYHCAEVDDSGKYGVYGLRLGRIMEISNAKMRRMAGG